MQGYFICHINRKLIEELSKRRTLCGFFRFRDGTKLARAGPVFSNFCARRTLLGRSHCANINACVEEADRLRRQTVRLFHAQSRSPFPTQPRPYITIVLIEKKLIFDDDTSAPVRPSDETSSASTFCPPHRYYNWLVVLYNFQWRKCFLTIFTLHPCLEKISSLENSYHS